MRFSEPQGGQVLIDGIDIASYSPQGVRRHIGLLPQTMLLLDASIHDNIAFGRVAADRGAVEAAARAACAHDFISEFAEGYGTRIGENGVKLSGGQKQRIALARALLKDPPILILDEATAMFDPSAEGAFVNGAAALLEKRTVLLITHHLAPLAVADRVLRVEAGRIVELAAPLSIVHN